MAYALANKSARRTGRVSYAAKARIERLQKDFDAPLLNTARLVRRRDKLAAIIAHNEKKNEVVDEEIQGMKIVINSLSEKITAIKVNFISSIEL